MMKLRFLILAGLLFVTLPLAPVGAAVGVSINIAPPVLPVVVQPPCPVAGYIWTPGYWAYGDVGYYWVPGIWVEPPAVGLLWTPPYWGFNNGVYAFNDGYWGPTVGFYGGINYGYGYFGSGYWGGRWDGNVFRYNTAVTRVNTTVIRNTFVDRSVLSKNVKGTRASFNGPKGVKAEATAEEKTAAENARKVQSTSQQTALREAASKNRDLQASVNHGHPKPEAIKSVRKEAAPTGEAAAGKAENKPGGTAAEAEAKKKAEGEHAAGAGKKEETAQHHRALGKSAKSGAAEHREGEARHAITSRLAKGHAHREQGAGKPGQEEQQQGKKKGKPDRSHEDR